MYSNFKIGDRIVGSDEPCLVIGEVAQAHDGSLGMAHAYIDAIANAGADAVKFQTHIARAESSLEEPWRIKFSYQDDTRYEYWKRMEFTQEQWVGLKKHAEDRGLIFISSPFSKEALDMLYKLGIQVWKVASGEVSNPLLFRAMMGTRLPIIVSTGMSDMREIDDIVKELVENDVHFGLLQCTSAYPCSAEKVGLNLVSFFKKRYNCPTGLSDHSGTIYPGLAGAALGLDILELHVTMSREMFGPDVIASVTTNELKQMVEGIRYIERMRCNPVDKDISYTDTLPLRGMFTKSIALKQSMTKGSKLSIDNMLAKKPGIGIPASRYHEIIGKKLKRDVEAGQILKEEDLED